MSEPTARLETVEIEPAASANAAVIWLHGLGADAHDFEPIVPAIRLPPAAAVRFVFPNAPRRAVTINAGFVMRAWFDIVGLEPGSPQDEAGIREAQAALEGLVAREIGRGIASERIVLAGFSQGGAVALHTGLRYPERLAGVLALSTFLPLADTLEAERHEANRELPLFLAHGTYDPVIGIEFAKSSRAQLEALGYPVEWHEYPMEHAVCPPEIDDLAGWLGGRLATG
jgi:phospholipase/carboxylesterase